jgi:hypothetical protein
VEIQPDVNKETACIASIIKIGSEFKLGTMIEGQPLAPLFRKYVCDVAPDTPCCLEDKKNVEGFEMFKHGTRLISRQVLAIREKKRHKRVREDIPYEELINFAKPVALNVLPLLLKSSSLSKKELIDMVLSIKYFSEASIMQDVDSINDDTFTSEEQWKAQFILKFEQRLKGMFSETDQESPQVENITMKKQASPSTSVATSV